MTSFDVLAGDERFQNEVRREEGHFAAMAGRGKLRR